MADDGICTHGHPEKNFYGVEVSGTRRMKWGMGEIFLPCWIRESVEHRKFLK